MSNERFYKLSAQKQEAILEAAADEFAERGYEAASMNRIVERAGSSKGALYYYFDSKADLLATVVERAVARVLTEVAWPTPEGFTAETYWEQVREVTRRSIQQFDLDTWYMRILRSFYRLRDEPAAREATAGVLDQGRDLARGFLQRGQELGVVRTDLPLDLLVEIHMAADEAGDRWMLKHWAELSEPEKVKMLDALADLYRDMLDANHMGWDS
jgi:AcrR family transcriptional regulator